MQNLGRLCLALSFPLVGWLGSHLLLKNTANITSSLQSGTNATLVEVQFLAEHKMKVSREARCTAYVDMTTAASRLPMGTPEAAEVRNEAVKNSLNEGWDAKCYVDKSPLEALPYGLRVFWEPRHAKLSSASECSGYVDQSNSLVYGPGTESERQFARSQLYVQAEGQGCYRN